MAGWNRGSCRWSLLVLWCLCGIGLQALAQTPIGADTSQSKAAQNAGQIPSVGSSSPATGQGTTGSAAQGTTAARANKPLRADPDAKLDIGDLIEINVFGVPELATKTRIGESGDIYLPLIDYVHLADLTVDEAQELIQKRLEDGGFVKEPHVTIFVDESTSQAIIMLGEVARPGPYPAVGERRLFDLISAAGGLTDKAGRAVTIEHRDDPDNRTILQLPGSLADDTKDNIPVYPGDTIIFSRAGVIYVVGDVNHPSGFLIQDDTVTVLKALALAGGSTKTSALNKTRILRQTPGGGIQEIPIQLKKILYAKSPDVPMTKGDVLFIPGSAGKAAAYETASVAMSLTTALAIVAIQ
jgi:polysaccharide biosynthesis/export protein